MQALCHVCRRWRWIVQRVDLHKDLIDPRITGRSRRDAVISGIGWSENRHAKKRHLLQFMVTLSGATR